MLYTPDEIPWHVRLMQLPYRALRCLGVLWGWIVWPLDFCLHLFARGLFGTVESLEVAEYGVGRVAWVLFAPLRLLRYLVAQIFWLIGAFVIWPIEYLVVRLTGKVFAAFEASEGVGFFFTRMRWAVASRFQMLREAAAESTGITRFILNVLTAPLYVVGWLTHVGLHTFMLVAEFFSLDIFIAWIIRWTRLIWYPIVAAGGFVCIWFATRTRRQLAWGIPAAIILLPAIWIVGEKVVTGNARVAENYRMAVNAARHDNDMAKMYLFERKLTQLGVDTQTIDFYTALSFAQSGKYGDAYDRMRKLAPENQPGHANAHIWIIQCIIGNQLKLPAEEAHRLVGVHLDHLTSLKVDGPEIQLFRAYWLAEGGRDEEAAAVLKPLVNLRPSTAVDRMRLDLRLNHLDEARKDAVIVEEFMERSKRNGEKLTASDYQWWSVAEDILGHEVRLRAVVNEWLKADPKNQDAIATLGRLLVNDLQDALTDTNLRPEILAKQIQEASDLAGASSDLKKRVMQLYHQRSNNPALMAAFESLLQAEDLKPALAETLGTAAATDGEWAVARRALEIAVKSDPENAVAWNNLAFVLLQQGTDFDAALLAANQALKFNPDNYHLRETRGQILVKLRHWKEAIADLEYALNGLPDAPAIHNSLAVSYEAIGDARLSAVHRQFSN